MTDITPELAIAALPVLYGIWKVALKPVFTAVRKAYLAIMGIAAIKNKLDLLEADMRPNGGSSMRDAIDRVEKVVVHNGQIQRALLELLNTGFFIADDRGACVHVSRYWQKLTGMSPEDAMGTGWIHAIAEEDRDRIVKEWYSSAQEGRPFTARYRIVNATTGRTIWVTGQSIVLRSPTGAISGHIGTITEDYA